MGPKHFLRRHLNINIHVDEFEEVQAYYWRVDPASGFRATVGQMRSAQRK
jgi:hypothetical protein